VIRADSQTVDRSPLPSEVPESPDDGNSNEPESPPYPRGVLMPDYTKLVRDAAAMLDYSTRVGRGVMPDYSSLVGRGVMSDFSKLIGDAAAIPDFSLALRQVVTAPRIADSILSLIRVPSVPSVAGYRTAVDALLRSIGFDHESELPDMSVGPTSDDTAFRVIAQASPETAAAIALAADKARNPLLPAHIIRNMLAWLMVGLIVVAYVGGSVLFPPWGSVVVALLGVSGVTAPAVHKKISQPPDKNQA